MFAYYLKLALRSLKRNVVLTVLMIAAIGVGIGASMTTVTIFRAMDADPVPEKSGQLFAPQIDNWGPTNKKGVTGDEEHLQDQLSYTFSALADPTRRAILARLALGERSVTELAEPFEMSMPAVSKHLKVLERAGLISRGREAQWRPCRLDAGPLKEAAGWIEEYRRFWEQTLDRLDKYLREIETARTKSKTNGSGKKSSKTK